MNKIIFSIVCLTLFFSGCAQKEKVATPIESGQEIINESALEAPVTSASSVATPATSEQIAAVTQPVIPAATSLQEAMIPEKPTTEDVQKALKAAGLYEGNIDGKLGPKTKKAIEDFQTQNSLTVDGKVGPKTWEKLRQHLAMPETSAATSVAQ
ncbi:MAG: peptidoglycan-binding domain-containing protein [Candidatus Omnitrophica bacterium]|nr:peptidoglycan-binding domain-containing protein [Candidatus Omnitrophota bacterium]